MQRDRLQECDHSLTRRQLLERCGTGLGMLGLAGVLNDAEATAAERGPHFAPKARQVVHLFMNGGPSHVDTFDPKRTLDTHHGKKLPFNNFRTERRTGHAMRSPFRFRRHGQSGIPVSDLFEKTAGLIDEICVIRSMYADVPNHEPSLMLMNCGDGRLPRPSFGSWVTYGLGSPNRNLPGFIVMCPGGYPIVATRNWRSAFLPGEFQGTYIDTKHTDVSKLIARSRCVLKLRTRGDCSNQRRCASNCSNKLCRRFNRSMVTAGSGSSPARRKSSSSSVQSRKYGLSDASRF